MTDSGNNRMRLEDLFAGLDDEEIIGVALVAKSGKVRVWAADEIVADRQFDWLARQLVGAGNIAEGMGEHPEAPNLADATPKTRH